MPVPQWNQNYMGSSFASTCAKYCKVNSTQKGRNHQCLSAHHTQYSTKISLEVAFPGHFLTCSSNSIATQAVGRVTSTTVLIEHLLMPLYNTFNSTVPGLEREHSVVRSLPCTCLIPGISFGPLVSSGLISECRAICNSWASSSIKSPSHPPQNKKGGEPTKFCSSVKPSFCWRTET